MAFFKTFSENWVYPLLENKKFVLVILGLLVPSVYHNITTLAGEKAPPKPAAAPKPEQKKDTVAVLDCSKELASHIQEYDIHAESHN